MSTQPDFQYESAPAAMIGTVAPTHSAPDLLVYTADQVCTVLQISKVTLWRLERRGLIRPLPQLRHRRYAVEAVRRFSAGEPLGVGQPT